MKYLKDSIVALITPFNDDGSIDFLSFEKLINFHLEKGTAGIVICGTTAESPTLNENEKLSLLRKAKELINDKIPLVFGSGSNCTQNTINLTKKAEEIGIDGVLVVTPYYNKPTQEGLYQHYKAVANSTSLPIYLYNVPSRTGVDLNLETIIRLANIKNIVGLKDAVADLSRVFKLRNKLGENFILLSGEDETFLSYLSSGGNGCISVCANAIPNLCQNIHKAFNDGKTKEAITLQTNLIEFHSNMFCESNPAPIKYAVSLLGLCQNNVRQPLVKISAENQKNIQNIMKNLQII